MATFYGGPSDESATGTNNKDTLEGGGGNDSLYGLGDRDSLVGGDGNDQLFGGSDRDTLFGGNGDDLLDSGTGDESVFGGTGADRILLTGSFGDDTVSGGEVDSATDTLDASALASGVTVTVSSAETDVCNASVPTMSTGTMDSTTVRSSRRVPVTVRASSFSGSEPALVWAAAGVRPDNRMAEAMKATLERSVCNIGK